MTIKTNNKGVKGGVEMKTSNKGWLMLLVCLGLMLFAVNVQAAEEEQAIAEELISGLDIPADVASTIVNGQGTLGERVEGAYSNGSLNQKQYDAITNRFLALPDEKRWTIKGGWDAGKGVGSGSQLLHKALNPQDEGSVRDHIKDLKAQGYTREQIKNRLTNEGVDPAKVENLIAGQAGLGGQAEGQMHQHIKDLRAQGYTKEQIHNRLINEGVDPAKIDAIIAGEANRREHLGDLREEGLSREQARERAREMVETEHAKDKRDEIKGTDRRGHARDIEHERPAARERSKDVRDTRRGQDIGRDRRGRTDTMHRGRQADVGRGRAAGRRGR